MLKCAQSVSGVLMIVGLAFIAGSVQSLLRDRPIVLGVTQQTTEPEPAQTETQAATNADDSQEAPDAEVATAGDEPAPGADPLLDAPGPAGTLTLRQAHQHWVQGAYFIDSRTRHDYEAGHVAEASYLTAENIFTDEGAAVLEAIPVDATVVIYCTGGDGCDASKNTQALMQQYGYTSLLIMGLGYDEWAKAGLPISNDDLAEEGGAP